MPVRLLDTVNGMRKQHELRDIGALPACQVANPAQLSPANPDSHWLRSRGHDMQLISGDVVKQSDTFQAANAAVMERLKALQLLRSDGPGLTSIQEVFMTSAL